MTATTTTTTTMQSNTRNRGATSSNTQRKTRSNGVVVVPPLAQQRTPRCGSGRPQLLLGVLLLLLMTGGARTGNYYTYQSLLQIPVRWREKILLSGSSPGTCSSHNNNNNNNSRTMIFRSAEAAGVPQQQNQQQYHPRILLVTYLFTQESANKRFLQLFLTTAATAGVDVVLVGDARPPYPLPINVHHYCISWEDFITLAETKLHFDGTLLRTAKVYYKVNDFKPTLAYLLPELVHGYDWWGTIDNDVLLGNVGGILAKYLKEGQEVQTPQQPQQQPQPIPFDIISGTAGINAWGPMTLYRNTDRINTLFRLASVSAQEIFGVPHYNYFDEWPHFGGGAPGTTMSTIIEQHRHTGLLLRVQQGVEQYYPVWDGPYLGGCFTKLQPRCAECVYATTTTNTTSSTRLLHWVDGQYRETIMCHYQKSKSWIETLLTKMSIVEQQLLSSSTSGGFQVTAVEGLQPLPPPTTITTTTL